MTQPATLTVPAPDGPFRVLHWGPNSGNPSLFLHGLTGVAEVWGPTITSLPDDTGPCHAMDQRGHGHSPKPATRYAVGNYVRDAAHVIEALGLAPVRLVGHSMGARVAMVLAARRPELARSVAIVDIGPEEWRANWQQSVAGLNRVPESFPSVDAAIGGAARARGGESMASASPSEALREIAIARLKRNPDGSWSWLASRDALKQTVISHRSRNFWQEWRAIRIPALFVRGGASTEVRPVIAERMRQANPRVRYEEFEGVGHNIPLLAPARLADTLSRFWDNEQVGQG